MTDTAASPIVAAAQFAPLADKDANLRRITDLAEQAAHRGARLAVFPEYASFFTGRLDHRMLQAAEATDGPFTRALDDLATRLDLTIVAGLAEETDEPGRFSSTVVAVVPGRGLVASYRKQHVYDAFGTQESRWVRPGPLEQPPTFLLDTLRFGLQSCYDLRFPEVTRRLADAGADVVLVPAEWVPGPQKRQHWRTLLRARAIENTMFVVGAGQTAPGGIGNSMVVDPSGKTLAQAEDKPGMACAALSASVLMEVRRINPSLSLRRYSVMPGAPDSLRDTAGVHPVKFIPE